jgi:hypothetical protein
MLFEACIGERMWKGVKEVEILKTLLARKHLRSPQSIVPTVHDDLDAICHRALSVIEHRYRTAKEMLHDLEAHLEEHVEQPTREQISEMLKTRFAEKRAIVEARIDAKLKALAARNAGQEAPMTSIPRLPMRMVRKTPAAAFDSTTLVPVGPGEPTPRVPSAIVVSARGAVAPNRPNAGGAAVASEARREPIASRRRTLRTIAMLIVAAVFTSLVTLLLRKLL